MKEIVQVNFLKFRFLEELENGSYIVKFSRSLHVWKKKILHLLDVSNLNLEGNNSS